jgi:hypothetical protein
MAGAGTSFRRVTLWAAVVLALAASPGCSELSGSMDNVPPATEPAYVPIAAKHLQSVLKDRMFYDAFEISGVRWVHSLEGWNWLACVRFRDHGHPRTYALFIAGDAVVNGRYAVETDACDSQTFIQFDLVTGELGKATIPAQQPIY